jgi:1-acyl-sn-glycerol-3-phosphate acyltransferase
LIAFLHNEQDKPKPPGIIVSNHLTANDVMVIASDVGLKQNWLYTVTGQQHAGVIGYIQMLVSVSYILN